jgi:hypothetical protein
MAGVMKPPQPRTPQPVSPGEKISDKRLLTSMIFGTWSGWEQLNPDLGRAWPKPTAAEYERAKRREINDSHAKTDSPYNFLEEVAVMAKVDAWQRRQHERLMFLLEGGYLAGPAPEEAALLKREYETGERR